ncbi:glycoside hydrolase family 43 protein [Lacrimispora sp.]|uniref:glycoside hydrolase family 43 protein n=1 Tax=Lacrimispora sp. TaxID=2719234 RepID=UPI0032E37C0F
MGSGKKYRKAVKYTAAVLVMVLMVLVSITLAAGRENAFKTNKKPEPLKRVSVHDPSIIKAKNGEYYIFGSHLAGAKSKNLMDWESLGKDYENVTDNWLFGNIKENLAESFRWAGYDDGDCAGGKYAVWAPDVIWNPYYNNGGGTKGAYMIYYSASSTWRRSCIGYAVSQDIEGPYTYVGTVVYSGFTKNGKPDGNSQRNTRWDTDAIHIKKLIDSGRLKNGIRAKWFTGEEWNHNNCPNAIDPTLFFDAQGQRLYMVYGSWSGGIYLLELDRETGDAKYPGTDSVDKISGNYVDRYFGIHLAGGNHQSGEGPYIVYDDEAGYYYLYETYGALTANGGYNMRMFRSKEVTGPYLDAAGNNAADSYRNNDQYGVKLIGNYKLAGTNTGYKAAGHNSAFIDEDGQHYLIYHQRFDQGTEYHEVRVHQQFLNQKGWPVIAVYENRNEKAGHYPDNDITGTYEFINHGLDTSTGMISPESITLLANGKIGGDREGTWKKIKGDRYDYVTINMEGAEYHGVFYRQLNEKTGTEQVMTFTAIGDNNMCIWGTREK